MAKISGLGQRFYVCKTGTGNGPAYNVTGDVGAIGSADLMLATFDTTGIDKLVHERLPAVLDAKLQVDSFWNPAPGGITQVMEALVQQEGAAIWAQNASENVFGFGLQGLITDWVISRAANGALTTKFTAETDAGYGGWGQIGANATDTTATAHTALDGGLRGLALSITAISVANPTHLTITAHGLTNLQSVNIVGSNSTPTINGDWVATVIDANTISIPVNVTVSGSGTATLQSTSTFSGGWYIALVDAPFTGTSMTPKLQDSADGVTYNDLTGMTSGTALTGTTSVVLVAATATAMWRRFLKCSSTGTFSSATWQCLVHRSEP